MTYLNPLSVRWRYHFTQLLALIVVLPLVGCSILPETPKLQVYLLPAHTAPAADGNHALAHSLRVAQPNTSQFLSGSRIAVQPQGAEITVYSNSRWSDPTPALLRNRLIEEFRSNGNFRSVSSDEDTLQADFELGGDLSSFQSIYRGNQGRVEIRFDARLVRTMGSQVLANRRFVVQQPINGRTMDDVVNAFGLAGDQLAEKIVTWALQQVAGGG